MKYFFLIVLPIFILPSLVLAQHSKIDIEVQQEFHKRKNVPVLIVFNQKAELRRDLQGMSKTQKGFYVHNQLKTVADQSQFAVREYLTSTDTPHKNYSIVNAISARLTTAQIRKITQFPEVKRVIPDFEQQNYFPQPEARHDRIELRGDLTYGLEMIKAQDFWDVTGKRGEGVIIAGQDTGYDWEHEALRDAYRGNHDGSINHNYAWHDAIHHSLDTSRENPCGFNLIEPCDDHGHGTHTMGTMAGQDVNDKIFGVAPNAQWIGCRNMENGIGAPSTYLECFEWFLAPTDLNGENPRPDLAPDLINNSWACIPDEGCNSSNFEILEQAVNNLTTAGILVVVSAGNDGRQGCETVNSPAAIYENSFTVGAVDQEVNRAAFSGMGPVSVDSSYRTKPNVVAPGVSTYSAYPENQYVRTSGTSMAGPHVAGLAALLLSAYPELKGNPHKTMQILENSATKMPWETGECYTETIPNNVWGYGLVNGISALDYLDSLQNIEIDKSDLIVYPTLSSSTINFLLTTPLPGKVSIRVFNISGQEVYHADNVDQIFSIDISAYPPGIYYYQLKHENNSLKGKFIKHLE